MHHLIDTAIAASTTITMPFFYNEWEPINKEALKPSKLYSLYSELQQSPSITCAPDAGFLLEKSGHKKVFYLEVDRGTDSIARICSKKPKGYARMAKLNYHINHFPQTTCEDFGILFVTTSEHRRNELVKRFERIEGNSLWKFAYVKEVHPDSFFFKPIWHGPTLGKSTFDKSQGEIFNQPHSLVKT